MKLTWNTQLENYRNEGILIDKLSSDESILFIDKSELKINYKNFDRVKTKYGYK